MSTSIVIPVYSRFDLLHQLLYDIYKNCSLVEEIIICNDFPEDKDVRNGLAWWKSTNMLPLEIIETSENIGFLRNANLGLKAAVEDNVFLISTDVRIHKDIIQHSSLVSISHSLWGGRLLDWNTGWNSIGNTIYPYIEGWLLGTTKENWENIGYFDERFAPYDMEDVDASTTARELGMILCAYPEGYVSHLGAQSIPYGDEREAVTKINKKKFEEKWAR